eukprot:3191096-Pyramimonas_sp.AAC.1
MLTPMTTDPNNDLARQDPAGAGPPPTVPPPAVPHRTGAAPASAVYMSPGSTQHAPPPPHPSRHPEVLA